MSIVERMRAQLGETMKARDTVPVWASSRYWIKREWTLASGSVPRCPMPTR